MGANADALAAIDTAFGIDVCLAVQYSDRFGGTAPDTGGAAGAFLLVQNHRMTVGIHLLTFSFGCDLLIRV